MAELGPSLVIDNGSGSCKVGYAGDHEPEIVFPSKVGRPRAQFVNNYQHLELKESYVGHDAQANRQVLHMKYPVERGIIKHWEDIEKLWHHAYKELDLFSEEHPILLTDIPNNPAANREKMAQIMFETFNTPAMYIAVQGILALYAYGLVTGVAVDSGADVTQIVPAVEGFSIPDATQCLDLGGNDLTTYLTELLSKRGIDFTAEYSIEDACKIKEELCYVSSNFKKETESENEDLGKTYKLPDEQIITVKSERFRCPEPYFQPSLLNKEYKGLHKICYDNIMKCDESEELVREELFTNIVLSGGSTLFPGFAERMEHELATLASPATKINVMAVPSREYNVWLGGSIIASQTAFSDMWVWKHEYEESGPSIVHKKCV